MSAKVVLAFLIIWIPGYLLSQSIDPSILRRNISPDVVIVKLKEAPDNLRVAQHPLDKIQELIPVKEINPVVNSPANGRLAKSSLGIERIFRITLKDNEPVANAVNKLRHQDWIEYAEPLFLDQLLYTPNDPHAAPGSGNQYHLSNINAYNAWNIEKGDTNIVVAIVDTGVDTDHPDLAPNIAYNYDDPINGVDDDGDGFIDNFMGWDIADNDNNPNTDGNGHGNIVTGISSAKTNNGIGLAGVGFNSRFLPVKILQNFSGFLVHSYDGVLYAANQGCQVINLSWGGPWNYSAYAQDIINYVVLDRDAVVVSAAGNTPDEIDFYPASYDNVLSVTASDASDNFANWATYSYHVDLMAPGQSIFSANKNGGYSDGGNGTSYSAPMVAGAAALVRKQFPLYDARQVMEQLRVTATNVSGIGNNASYEGRIGRGKLNVAKALADSTLPSIRIHDFSFTGNYGDYIFPGDTIVVQSSVINFLRNVANPKITFTTEGNTTVSDDISIGASSLGTYEQLSVDNWQVIIDDNLVPYSRLLFKADIKGNNYSDWDYHQLRTAPWYIDVTSNSLQLTVTSDGDLGYDRDSLYWGEGLWFGNEQLANYLGIIISREDHYLANNVVTDYGLKSCDQDFVEETYVRMYNNSTASLDARSTFVENEVIDKNGLSVEQKILGWDDLPDNDFFVLEYRLTNRSDSVLNAINLALFSDWDINNPLTNSINYDAGSGIAYAFSPAANNLFAGLALLNSGDTSMYAIDKSDQNGHTPDMDSLFTDSLKIAWSQSDFVKTQAGNLAGGNDIASLMGYRNVDLNPGESKKLAFVMMAATSLDQLKNLVERAKTYYQQYLDSPPFEEFFYACQGDSAMISFDGLPFKIFADAAQTQLIDSTLAHKTTPILHDTAFFVSKVIDGIAADVRKIVVRPRMPQADFMSFTDTLFIATETLDTITFFNQSVDASIFNWDLGNGYFSTNENPVATYSIAGEYDIKFLVENDMGCRDSIAKTLVVVERSVKPIIENQRICKGESASISAQNTSSINVYDSPSLNILLFSGNEFVTAPLQNSISYYITNDEGNESLPVKVNVEVSHPDLAMEYAVDTLNLDKKYLLSVQENSLAATSTSWDINGQGFSTSSVLYDYENDAEINIRLFGQDSLACSDTIQALIVPQQSGSVALNDVEICINESVTIRPQGGELFYFYGDAEQSRLLHKGREFTTGPIRQDTTFFVTNVDQWLEGEVTTMEILLKPLKAEILMTPESMNLATDKTVLLRNVSEAATESYWLLPSGSVDFSNEREEVIEQPGSYGYTLIAKSGESCVDTAKVTLVAYLITALEESEVEGIIFYPNPADARLLIQAGTIDLEKVELVDASGKLLGSKSQEGHRLREVEFNVSGLANGIYLVRLHTKDRTIISKIIVQH